MPKTAPPRLQYRWHYAYRNTGFVATGSWFVSDGRARFQITPQEAQLLLAVMLGPKPPDKRDLTEILWPDADDQPDAAWTVIRVYVHKLNQILRQFGWELNAVYPRKGRGWTLQELLK